MDEDENTYFQAKAANGGGPALAPQASQLAAPFPLKPNGGHAGITPAPTFGQVHQGSMGGMSAPRPNVVQPAYNPFGSYDGTQAARSPRPAQTGASVPQSPGIGRSGALDQFLADHPKNADQPDQSNPWPQGGSGFWPVDHDEPGSSTSSSVAQEYM